MADIKQAAKWMLALLLSATIGVSAAIGGCMWGKKDIQQSGDVTITNVRGDVPEFKRRYEVRINSHVTMKIEIHSTAYGTYDMSELDQTGGGWVLFDLNKPADKILDRAVLPIVQKYCLEIKQEDKLYRDSRPNEFTDQNGDVWRRAN